jgi:type IV pilus assembly protein PilW
VYKSIYRDPVGCGTNETPAWNGVAGVSYNTAKAYNLGPRPDVGAGLVAKLYAVRNGRLTTCDILTSDCTANGASLADTTIWVPIADDVVALKALYGLDDGATGTAGDGIVDSWVATTPTTLAGWNQMLASRIFIVARGKQYSKNGVTTNSLLPWGDILTFDISQTSPAATPNDWMHYRYRTFETKVPFRNMIWK